MKRILAAVALAVAGVLLMVPGTSLYFESGDGLRCTSCHEMTPLYDRWHSSTHRAIGCEKCHGGALTFDASFYLNNARRAVSHMKGDLPEQIEFGNEYVQRMNEQCAGCHRQEFADWRSGPHSATYRRIFADTKHNSSQMLMDDCLRCHGMHFEGGVRDVVAPIDRKGPWKIVADGLADRPSMPCLACHQMHRTGSPMSRREPPRTVAGPAQEIARPSLALFDRRTRQYIPVAELPMPAMMDGNRRVKMSPDQRQALCYQCHAPMATLQVASGDDRTATGVHEGISCIACHQQHGETTRASCATCHPKMSNCGLDVEKMDTTFRSTASRHNIHWVKCADCHPNGVPRKTVQVSGQ